MTRKYNNVGRPPRHVKAQRELAINLSWDVVLRYLENPRAEMKHKVEVAKSICVKNIPQEIEGKNDTYIHLIDELTNSNPTTLRSVVEALRESVSNNRPLQLN